MAKKPETDRKQLSEPERKKRAEQWLKLKSKGRRAYIDADKLLEELRDGGMQPGDSIELPGDRRVTLVDVFSEKAKTFKTVTVGRYDLEVNYE